MKPNATGKLPPENPMKGISFNEMPSPKCVFLPVCRRNSQRTDFKVSLSLTLSTLNPPGFYKTWHSWGFQQRRCFLIDLSNLFVTLNYMFSSNSFSSPIISHVIAKQLIRIWNQCVKKKLIYIHVSTLLNIKPSLTRFLFSL